MNLISSLARARGKLDALCFLDSYNVYIFTTFRYSNCVKFLSQLHLKLSRWLRRWKKRPFKAHSLRK